MKHETMFKLLFNCVLPDEELARFGLTQTEADRLLQQTYIDTRKQRARAKKQFEEDDGA